MTTNVATEVTPGMRVTRNVKHLLLMRDMTSQDLAAALGWSPSKTSRILNGKTGWDLNDLPAVAEVFALPYTALFETPAELLARTSDSTHLTGWYPSRSEARSDRLLGKNRRATTPFPVHVVHPNETGPVVE